MNYDYGPVPGLVHIIRVLRARQKAYDLEWQGQRLSSFLFLLLLIFSPISKPPKTMMMKANAILGAEKVLCMYTGHECVVCMHAWSPRGKREREG